MNLFKKVYPYVLSFGLFLTTLPSLAQLPSASPRTISTMEQMVRSKQTKTNNTEMSEEMPVFRSDNSYGSVNYQVHILGRIKTPGTFRIPASTRLDEAIAKAGGVIPRGSTRKVEIRRSDKVYFYDLFKFKSHGDLRHNPFLMDNDIIFVPFAESNVAVEGPVKSDGVYELTAKEKSAWDLIELAGGYTAGVDERGEVVVARYVKGEKKLIKVDNIKRALEKFELLDGDLVIVPHMMVRNRRFDYETVKMPVDNVYYPEEKNEVYVVGDVGKQGAFEYNASYKIRDYIHMAGMNPRAKVNAAYILTADGRRIRHPHKKRNFRVSPGDTIVVPPRLMTSNNFLRWYNTFTSTVFTSFALKELIQ